MTINIFAVANDSSLPSKIRCMSGATTVTLPLLISYQLIDCKNKISTLNYGEKIMLEH